MTGAAQLLRAAPALVSSPFEILRGAVHLVIVLAEWEGDQFLLEIGEPDRTRREIDLTTLDHGRHFVESELLGSRADLDRDQRCWSAAILLLLEVGEAVALGFDQ